jgi:hypothetical protein
MCSLPNIFSLYLCLYLYLCPASFSLFSQIPALCEMYIKGADGLQGAQNYLVSHANKVTTCSDVKCTE